MRILILSDADSVHTKRWVRALSKKLDSIVLFSFFKSSAEEYSLPNVRLVSLWEEDHQRISVIDKVKYIYSILIIRRLIREYRPNLIHAHYASSYGLVNALIRFQPKILSVWGSDVYSFPRKNLLFKEILKFNLRNTDIVLSTSKLMGMETERYTNKKPVITPFGVDLNLFKKSQTERMDNSAFVVGTVKGLSKIYGIDIAIRAFSKLVRKNPDKRIEFHIAGMGDEFESLKKIAQEEGISDKVFFLGFVENARVSTILNTFDVFIALSRSESFGVSVVEALACQLPVVVSNADGFLEIVDDGQTGLIVEKENSQMAYLALERLYNDPKLRKQMGKNGREKVERDYNWVENVNRMHDIYVKAAQ